MRSNELLKNIHWTTSCVLCIYRNTGSMEIYAWAYIIVKPQKRTSFYLETALQGSMTTTTFIPFHTYDIYRHILSTNKGLFLCSLLHNTKYHKTTWTMFIYLGKNDIQWVRKYSDPLKFYIFCYIAAIC